MSSSYKGPRAAKASGTAAQKPSQESKNSGNDDAKNKQSGSKQPDLTTKYAKYLQDDDTSKFDEALYKPTIRADRHQAGYSESLNQRRNRVNGNPTSGVAEDVGRRSRATTRPHIRSYSLNRPSTSATSGVGSSSSSTSNLRKNAESAQPTARQRNRLGDDLPTKSRMSRADVLEEESASTGTLPKTGLFPGVFPSKETMSSSSSSSSSCTSEDKDSSRPFSTKSSTGGTSSRASRSGRTVPGEDILGRFRAESKSSTTCDGAPANDSAHTKPFKVGSTREPGKRYFATVGDFDAQETPRDNAEQTSSTPRSRSKPTDASDTEFAQENATPRKTYLSPESCWNAKYFPPPYESSPSSDRTNRHSIHLDPSSCRESPIRGSQEGETEPKSSPRPSYRNGIFEHLRSQESRRSHSLDSRNRTPSRESVSPSPMGGKTRRRSRIEQMNSLNESNFESKDAFKEHLLNLTMNKDEYEDLMQDFKNGSIVEELNTVGIEDQPEIVPEIVVNEADDCLSGGNSNSGDKSEAAVKDSGNENPEQESCASKEAVDQTTKEDVAFDEPDSKAVPTEEAAPAVNIEVSDAKDSNQETKDVVDDDANSKKKPPDNSFKLLEEMIQAAREKYSSPDLRKSSESQVTLEPILSEELTHKWRFQKTEFGIPTSMGVTSDGCVIVADYGNSCLEYFSNSGDFEHKIEGVKPFAIVVNKKDNIYVGDRRGKAIRVFDKFGADVAQWESKTFGWISGLALLQNGNLVICDRDRCKVGIYTIGGELVIEFASYGVSNSQICMADFLAVDSKDRIIVADSGNHCLKLFDTNGKAIGKIGSRGTDNGCLEWPKGICVDRNDNIIVADMHNNRVSMFSTSGDFVQQLLSMTPNPYNVCYGQEAGMFGTLHYSLKGFSQYDLYAF